MGILQQVERRAVSVRRSRPATTVTGAAFHAGKTVGKGVARASGTVARGATIMWTALVEGARTAAEVVRQGGKPRARQRRFGLRVAAFTRRRRSSSGRSPATTMRRLVSPRRAATARKRAGIFTPS
jgi:hypothetical protein